MKSNNQFLSVVLLFVYVIGSAFSNLKTDLPEMPKYNKKMYKPSVYCSASSLFFSCSVTCGSNQQCYCEASLFSCSCSCTGGGKSINLASSLPSVQEKQYENWIKFANLLKKLNTEKSRNAYIALVDMANYLIKQDAEKYNQQATLLNELLQSLSPAEKAVINDFLASEKSDIRI